jgi:hypothetical protein
MKADDFYHEKEGYLQRPVVVVDQEAEGNFFLDRFIVFYASDWDEGGPNTFFAKFGKSSKEDSDWELQGLDHEFDTMWSPIWNAESGFRK